MARIRTIKPQFFTNERLAVLDPYARLLFIGLWTLADREGRLEDRPLRIKAEVFPYENIDVKALLDALEAAEFIVRYTVGKLAAIQVINFSRHQNPHIREAASTIPAPGQHHASTVLAPGQHGESTVQEQFKHSSSPAGMDTSGMDIKASTPPPRAHTHTRTRETDDSPPPPTPLTDELLDEFAAELEKKIAAQRGAENQQAGPAPASFDRDAEIASWPHNATLRETFTLSRKIPPEFFEPYIEDFKAEIAGRKNPHKDADDLRRHFLNYAGTHHEIAQRPKPRHGPPKNGIHPRPALNDFRRDPNGPKVKQAF